MKYFLLPIIAYAAWALFCFFGQRWILYPGRSIQVPAAPALPAGAERLSVRTSTGNVEAWYLPAKGKAAGKRPAVIMFHGNGEVIDFLEPEADGFRQLGMGALLVEFPGYGRSAGKLPRSRLPRRRSRDTTCWRRGRKSIRAGSSPSAGLSGAAPPVRWRTGGRSPP